jgi:hypothetical protein
MCNIIQENLTQEGLRLSYGDFEVLEDIYNNNTPDDLEDEISEFFREIAALQEKNVDEIKADIKLGMQNYLEAVNTKIEFNDDLPINIEQYFDKLEKIATGIEFCWDIFSPESKRFFIQLAQDYLELKQKRFSGFKGLILVLKLIVISWKSQKNLLHLYKRSFLLIPEAVNRAIQLRDSKPTKQLQEKIQLLRKQVHQLQPSPKKLHFQLSNLGKDTEDQIRKNQPAMAWAKKRLEELEKIRYEQNI